MNATVVCEPAVLKESLILEEEYANISKQFLTWKDGIEAYQ